MNDRTGGVVVRMERIESLMEIKIGGSGRELRDVRTDSQTHLKRALALICSGLQTVPHTILGCIQEINKLYRLR